MEHFQCALHPVTRRMHYTYIIVMTQRVVTRYVTIVPAKAERDLRYNCARRNDVVKMLQGIQGSGNVPYIRETIDMTERRSGQREMREEKNPVVVQSHVEKVVDPPRLCGQGSSINRHKHGRENNWKNLLLPK